MSRIRRMFDMVLDVMWAGRPERSGGIAGVAHLTLRDYPIIRVRRCGLMHPGYGSA
jgi:hypothetical protein